jgi:hypothetical protein
MSRLFVFGDTHGSLLDSSCITTEKWPESKSLTKEDVNIQLGDFGWVFHDMFTDKSQEYNLDQFAGRRWTCAILPGNHDNYDIIESLPLIEKWGGKVRVMKREAERPPIYKGKKTKNKSNAGELFFLERGEVYTINGKTFWVMGGALSIDRAKRVQGFDYWLRETPSYSEMRYGMDNLDKVNWKVDYVLTHTCPVSIMEWLLKIKQINTIQYMDHTSNYLEEVLKSITFKEWHFGHFHKDVMSRGNSEKGELFACHYNNPPFELK